jgi:hypothetical protein
VHVVNESLSLLPSDLKIGAFEEEFAIAWQRALDGEETSFDVISRPWRITRTAVSLCKAQLVLVDMGPNLSAMNRAGLVAADHIVIPLAPDQLTVLGLESLGSALRKWRGDWHDRLVRAPSKDMELPAGSMAPLGYAVQQPGMAVRAGAGFINWIPDLYRKWVLHDPPVGSISISNDPNKLAILRPYRSLLEMAQEARKPMFHLKPADGAMGAHLQSAEDARKDFDALARVIVSKANLPIALAAH